MSEAFPAIPAPEAIDRTSNDEVKKIEDWFRAHTLAILVARGLASPEDPLSIGPRAGKESGDPFNRYLKPPFRTMSTDVIQGKDTLFCTHGVVLPTMDFQIFEITQPETIVVCSGSLEYVVNGTSAFAHAGDLISVEPGQKLHVRSKVPIDYMCFYGLTAREYVLRLLQQ